MITLSELVQIGIFLVALIALCKEIFSKEKDSCHSPNNDSHS